MYWRVWGMANKGMREITCNWQNIHFMLVTEQHIPSIDKYKQFCCLLFFLAVSPLSSSASSLSFSLFVCILNLCYVILYAGHRYFVFAANLSQYPSIFLVRKVSVSKQNIATIYINVHWKTKCFCNVWQIPESYG